MLFSEVSIVVTIILSPFIALGSIAGVVMCVWAAQGRRDERRRQQQQQQQQQQQYLPPPAPAFFSRLLPRQLRGPASHTLTDVELRQLEEGLWAPGMTFEEYQRKLDKQAADAAEDRRQQVLSDAATSLDNDGRKLISWAWLVDAQMAAPPASHPPPADERSASPSADAQPKPKIPVPGGSGADASGVEIHTKSDVRKTSAKNGPPSG